MLLKFAMPPYCAGGLIGKGGHNLKSLRERSGCKINVSDDVHGDRIVQVLGQVTPVLWVWDQMWPNV